MGAGDLSAALWQERRQLELLLFRLETQRLHVVAGNLEWLNFTASEVETVLDRLRFEALARSVESAAVAAEWGLPAQTTLVELIAAAPPGPGPRSCGSIWTACADCLARLGEAARVNEEALRSLPTAGTPRPGRRTAGLLDQLTTAGNIERALAVRPAHSPAPPGPVPRRGPRLTGSRALSPRQVRRECGGAAA